MSNRKEIRDLVVFDCKGVTPKYVKHSNTIVLNQKCIKEFKLDYSLAQFISQEQKISEEKYLKVGDIVINSTGQGTAGRCAIVSYIPDGYKVTVDSHMLIIRCLDINTAYILAYNIYLNESYIMKLLTGSSGQAELDKVRLYNINIAIPKNKKTFKDFLVLIQNKIENNNKINEELESMAKTIYDYWFLQFEFPNEEGNPYKSSGGKMVWNGELKREIPEGWSVKKIEDYCNIFTGKKDVNQSLNEGKYKFFSCGPDYRFSNEKIYEGKAILVSGNGSYTGRTIFVNDKFDLYQRTYACVNNGDEDILIYIYYSMLKTFVPRVRGGTHGSAIPYIVFDDIAKESLLINNKIVHKYVNIVEKVQKKIIDNNKENQELEQIRDFILQLLINGQVGFRELALAED